MRRNWNQQKNGGPDSVERVRRVTDVDTDDVIRKKSRFERRISPIVESDFPMFDQKIEKVSYKKKQPREQRDRVIEAKKPEDKYRQIQETAGLMDKLEAIINAYDYNHTRRCEHASEEYRHRVISPLQSQLKKQFTGETYRRRRKMMQPDAREPPHNIESLVIHTRNTDRTTKRKREDRKEQELEETVTGRVTLQIVPEYNRPLDDKARRDTRFFDGGGVPAKGTRIFAEKYQSSVGRVMNQF